MQGREKSFCSVGNWAEAPAPTLLPGRAILLPVSDVDRLLPGAAGLPQAPNRAAFIKRLSASERARGRGVWGERAESQPGRGAARRAPGPAYLHLAWERRLRSHWGPSGVRPELGRYAKNGTGQKLRGNLLSSSTGLPSYVPPAWLPPHLHCAARQKIIMEEKKRP